MVVLAVSESGAVGIDIEKIRVVNMEDFLQYVPEVADLRDKDDATHVTRLFVERRTQKEAILKGYGKGLLAPMEQIVIKDGMSIFCETTWFIKRLLIDVRYCCYVATDKPLEHVAVEHVNLMSDHL